MSKQPTVAELQARLAQLEGVLRGLGIDTTPAQPENADPTTRPDYVERGSDRHAALLGLRKATDQDTMVVDGWTLEDFSQFGPTVTKDYITLVLRQRVNELITPMPEIQTSDPLAPNYRPPMWTPRKRLSDMTE